MPRALETLKAMLPRIERGKVTALEAVEALLGVLRYSMALPISSTSNVRLALVDRREFVGNAIDAQT